MGTMEFIWFIALKLLFVLAMFSKAWLDVKGNKTNKDHIITGVFEASLVIAAVCYYYIGYNSPVIDEMYMAIPSYLLLRHGLFDMIRNKIAGTKSRYMLGSNNWLDIGFKRWLYKIEINKKIPVLTISRFVSTFFGFLI